MYIPKSKYSSPKYTSGEELKKPDGTFYRGYYVTDTKGQIYSGKKPSKSSITLTDSRETTLKPKFTFSNDNIVVTERNKQAGFIKRFFLQDFRTRKIIEVKKNKFDYFKNFKYIISLEVDWLLTEPVEDVVKGNYILEGSASKNEKVIKEQQVIKGLHNFFDNYYEVYSYFVKVG